jgi:hypothetical protein
MGAFRAAVRRARENWILIAAILINLAIAGPLAANWTDDICYINNRVVPCCTDCTFFCSCGESPAP